jgi:hypothetical protein
MNLNNNCSMDKKNNNQLDFINNISSIGHENISN